MKKRNVKGFTLIELVIVVIIIGILAVVSVPMYQKYTWGAMASEGKTLVGSVAAAERLYYNEHSSYLLKSAAASFDDVLGVSCGGNKYFTAYAVTGGANSINISTAGVGDAGSIFVTLSLSPGAAPIVTALKGSLNL